MLVADGYRFFAEPQRMSRMRCDPQLPANKNTLEKFDSAEP